MNRKLGFIAGIVFCFAIAAFILPLIGYITAQANVRDLRAEVATLQEDAARAEEIIVAQVNLIDAQRDHIGALTSLAVTAADTLEGIAFGPYTREETQGLILRIAEILGDVNPDLGPQAAEISEAIVTCAIAADVDPLLLTAMAILESNCRPEIRGRSGEYGMLQVMPGTGAWIASKLGYGQWEPADMFDVRQNVQFSAYYLRAVTREFGDTAKGVLAYNRGSTGARTWLQEHTPGQHCYVARVLSIYSYLVSKRVASILQASVPLGEYRLVAIKGGFYAVPEGEGDETVHHAPRR